MYQKLFQVTLVVFLVAVSVVALAIVISVVMSMFSPRMMAHTDGISVVAGGASMRLLGFMVIAVSLAIAGFYLFVRRRRFRR
jgi:hypothetical protein